MREAFRIWLIVFGLVCIGIAAAHLFVGQATYIGGGEVNATMDSDLRFYNVLFVAFGAGFVWAAQDLDRRATVVILLSALFLVGGLARLLAWVASGAPHWFYIAMIVVELVVGAGQILIMRRLVPAQAPEPASATIRR